VTGPPDRRAWRDAAGRPVPPHSAQAVAQVPEVARTPDEALALAQQLLDQGLPFYAHDVLEAAWKSAPAGERDLWQGLAQVCVGLTHEQRGNRAGSARLLRRGAERLLEAGDAHGVRPAQVAVRAQALADHVDAGRPGTRSLRLRG
jgi:uncharacterized protein